MSFTPTLRTLSAAAALGGTLAASALIAAPSSATPSSATCANVIQIVVRGTSEAAGSGGSTNVYASGGLGRMKTISDGVAKGSKKTVRTVGLKYQAAAWPSFTAPLGYITSETTGRSRMAAELNRLATACPSSRTVLIGYSQGAHVIGDAVSNSNPAGLTASARAKIAAIYFTGDPVRRPNEPFNRGSGVGGGILPDRAKGDLSGVASRLASYCLKGDTFCDSPHKASNGDAIHGTYGSGAPASYGISFILGKIG